MTCRLVTIGIPAYKNVFLKEAIESALAQSYRNIEVVIVNDASPYDLDSTINSFCDDRIRYYKNKKNLGHKGIACNWNKCLEYARGEFFVLLCDDDILLPNFVSSLLKLAYEYPDCNVFHARRFIKRINKEALDQEDAWPSFESSEDYTQNFLHGMRKHTVTEFLYRTKHIMSIEYQNFPVGFYSDNVSLMLFSREGGIVSSDEELVIFRESEIHISSNLSYNPGKALATRKFIRWIRRNVKVDDTMVDDFHRIENESLSYLYGAPGWTKIRVMFSLPISGITLKGITTHIVCLFRKKILGMSD